MLEFQLKQLGQVTYALCTSGSFVIEDEQSALELLMNAQYQGADVIVMDESCLDPSFFKLSSGLAGAIFQKFSNYGGRLIIVGDFEKFQSKSLNDLIFECNKNKQINFVGTTEEALALL